MGRKKRPHPRGSTQGEVKKVGGMAAKGKVVETANFPRPAEARWKKKKPMKERRDSGADIFQIGGEKGQLRGEGDQP